jgi:hypothetical protein
MRHLPVMLAEIQIRVAYSGRDGPVHGRVGPSAPVAVDADCQLLSVAWYASKPATGQHRQLHA